MQENKEEQQVDAERAIFQVLDVVCNNLCAKDLLSTAQVCKSWNFMVSREKSKRREIQRIRLLNSTKNLATKLDVVPSASLLLYSSELEGSLPMNFWEDDDRIHMNILENFKAQLPNKTVAVKSDEVVDSKLTSGHDILGIFFPTEKEKIRVNVAVCDSTETFMNTADYLAETLGMNECSYNKSTIILFYSYGIKDCRHFANLCRRERNKGKDITLASMCGKLISASSNNGVLPIGSTVALRISGPDVESESIYLHHLAQDADIESKFQEMKENLKPKRFNIGMIYTRKCLKPNCNHETHPVSDSVGMMQRLKRYFPDVRFTGLFKHCEYHYPPLMEVYDRYARFEVDEDFLTSLSYYASIIIISYD